MRPDRDEMLSAVRRALVEFVAPEVKTVYGRTELTYAISLLSALAREADDGVAGVVTENASLRRLLRDAARRLAPRGLLSEPLASELAALGPATRLPDLRLSALREENARLFDLFIRLQAACEDAGAQDRAAAGVLAKTMAFLRARAEAQAALPRGGLRG